MGIEESKGADFMIIVVDISPEDLSQAAARLARHDYEMKQVSLQDARLLYSAAEVIKREVEARVAKEKA